MAVVKYETFSYDRRYKGMYTPEVRRRIIKGAELLAQKVLAQAVENAPICTGKLRASGKVALATEKVIVVQFGGKDAPYAKEVEEGRPGRVFTHTTTYKRNGKTISYEHPEGHVPLRLTCGPAAGQWRRYDFSNPSQGRWYLRDAYRTVFGAKDYKAAIVKAGQTKIRF
jgi:hypothetical protein